MITVYSGFEGIFPVIKIFITGMDTFKGSGYNSSTVGILGLTYIPVPILLMGEAIQDKPFETMLQVFT